MVHTHSVAGFAHPQRNVSAFGIQPGMQVADFGSGSGAYVLAIAEALQGTGHVYAVDVQKDLLRKTLNEARQRGYKNVSIAWGDVEARHGSKLADSVVDIVLISNLLFQVEEKAAVMREAFRIAKVGGRLVVIDWTESFGNLGPVRDQVVTKEHALELAKEAGFAFEGEFAAGAHHYGLLLRRGPERKLSVKPASQ